MKMKRILLAVALLIPAMAVAADVEITTWKVPWDNTRPRDPDVDAYGRVWFVGQTGNYLAFLTPDDGQFMRFNLEADARPHNLIVAADGAIWYAGNGDAYIGWFDPEGGEMVRVDMPVPAASDPHTLIADARGDVWFTVQRGNFVGKVDADTADVSLVQVPTERALPYGIEVDGAGRPWFVEFGSAKLGTLDPRTLELTEIDLPRADARPRRIAITADGRVWYVDFVEGYLGAYDPAAKRFEEWRAPAGRESRPYAMATDDRNRLWFVETGPQPNRLIGFDPDNGAYFSTTEISDARGAVRHMVFRNGALWFGTDSGYIGRAVLP
jgi:virginiamycin B lyase